MDIGKRAYFSKCWESAKYHWVFAVIGVMSFVYGLIANYGNLVNLPVWLKIENWPKLPLSWATAIVFAALFLIAIEGGVRFHRATVKSFENIGGPDIFIGYIRPNVHWHGPAPLVVVNNKGQNAYTVVLKVPEDGSKFQSKAINILRDDGEPTIIPVGNGHLDGTDVLMERAEALPFIVECADGDLRKFCYRFDPPPNAKGGFLLADRKCVGRQG